MRKYLFSFFTLAFFIIAPLTVMYASGYKLDFKKRSISKTGSLILESEPAKARIYLDGKLSRNWFNSFINPRKNTILTPARIMNLLPGEYELKLELEGYWNWSKKISIYGNQTTIINDILLIKKDIPIIVDEKAGQELLASPKAGKIIYRDQTALRYYNPESDSVTTLSSTSSPDLRFGEVSQSGASVLAGSLIYLIDEDRVVDLSGLLPRNAGRLSWDLDDENSIWFSTPTLVAKIDLSKMALTAIYRGTDIKSFAPKNGTLYILENGPKNASLIAYDLAGGIAGRRIDLPASPAYEFINLESQYLNLHDTGSQMLYLIDPTAFAPLKETLNNVRSAEWINGGRLLYYNDHEILIYDPRENSKKIITRVSENIGSVIWHPSGKYIVYSAGGSLYSMESGTAADTNVNELIRMNAVLDPIIDKSGKVLYFFGSIGNQSGLYKLSL